MLEFIHAADLHLDSPLRGLAHSASHAELIREASRRALGKLVDEAIGRKAAFVIIAGDLWDVDWKDARTGNFFLAQMGRLDREDIAVFVVLGNHDLQGRWQARFRRMAPQNVFIFASDAAETKRIAARGLQVAVHGQSYRSRNEAANLAQGFPEADPGADLNIGILHTSLAGHSARHENYAPCSISDLRGRGYDYWALGHVHERKLIDDGSDGGPVIAYAGVLQGRHIRETGMKGAYAVDFNPSGTPKFEMEELDLSDVLWSTLTADLAGCSSLAQATGAVAQLLHGLRTEGLDDLECHVLRIVLANAPGQLAGSLVFNDDLRDELSGLAASVGEKLLIERVVIGSSATDEKAPAGADGSALAPFLNEAAAFPGLIEDMEGQLRTIMGKLPQEVREELAEDFSMPPSQQDVAHLLADTAGRLADALAGGQAD